MRTLLHLRFNAIFDRYVAAYLLVVGLVFIACKKEPLPNVTSDYINKPPTAFAGDDQVIIIPANSVSLKSSGIDIDGYILSYSWTLICGPVAHVPAFSYSLTHFPLLND